LHPLLPVCCRIRTVLEVAPNATVIVSREPSASHDFVFAADIGVLCVELRGQGRGSRHFPSLPRPQRKCGSLSLVTNDVSCVFVADIPTGP
jgi:hypothetical protein